MSSSRFAFLPVLSCSALLLLGGMGPVRPSATPRAEPPAPPAPPAPPSQPVPPAGLADDPAALADLDRALAVLAPGRLRWLEVGLWQRVTEQGESCEATGRYLAAPDGRVRLDLTTRSGGAAGTLQVVNDGTTLWQATRVGAGPWGNGSRYRVGDVRRQLSRPEVPEAVREDFLRRQDCAGVLRQLPALRQRLTWFRREAVRREGRLLVKLSGTWKPAEAAGLVRPGQPWPDDVPRQCRLYLDPVTGWPHRFEWWGPDPPRPGDALLIQLEFRDPVLNRPLSAEQCARAFRPDAEPALFLEKTADVADSVRAGTRRWYAAHRAPAP